MIRRVVKVGGSLLVRQDLAETLPRWLADQRTAETLVIVGGGEVVDAIRHLDRIRPGDPIKTHWLCVDLLNATYEVLREWFRWPSIEDAESLNVGVRDGFATESPTLVSVRSFYHDSLACDDCLPRDWRTTTDSIAALLADRVGADELILLKSCQVDPKLSLEQLVESGIVDESMLIASKNVKSIRVEQLP